MKEVAISSEKSKNKDRECVYTEPSLVGNIVYNGKRIKKNVSMPELVGRM